MAYLKLVSPAKLNLYLKVLNKRQDGYHDIVSLFERLDLCDTVIIKTNKKDTRIRIACRYKGVPSDSRNLAFKAARLLKKDFNIKDGISLEIIKRIPPGSGLGGGSSNAASVLLGLNRIFRLGLTKERLIEYALQIGSDVGFFVLERNFAVGVKRPELYFNVPLEKKAFWHVLVIPKIHVLTSSIYNRLSIDSCLDEKKKQYMNILTKYINNVKIITYALDKKDYKSLKKLIFNDLEKASFAIYPILKEIKTGINRISNIPALMSGSGSTIFGLARSRKEAEGLSNSLRASIVNATVLVVKTFCPTRRK
jgi:4-diphosphocytidyl-2-C-methyl-D-erythritol kinase